MDGLLKFDFYIVLDTKENLRVMQSMFLCVTPFSHWFINKIIMIKLREIIKKNFPN